MAKSRRFCAILRSVPRTVIVKLSFPAARMQRTLSKNEKNLLLAMDMMKTSESDRTVQESGACRRQTNPL